MKNKLLSIIMILSFVFSTFPIAGSAAVAENDILAEETGIMSVLGILTNEDMNSYNKNFQITRFAFIRLANRIMNISDYQIEDSCPFWDVRESDDCYDDIMAAYTFGFISGTTGDSARPYDIITYNEALKITCVLVGYNDYAVLNGGYPGGYINAASLGDFGVENVSNASELSFKTAVRLLFNALNAPSLSKNNDGRVTSYGQDNDNTLLKRKFKVSKTEGIVEANDITNLYYGGRIVNNGLMINGENYYVASDKYRDLLGMKVHCYYSVDDDTENNVVFVCGYKNTVIEINNEDLVGMNSGKLEYTDKNTGKAKNIKTSRETSFIYNGKAINYESEYSPDIFYGDRSGKVICTDNNSDGTYDVISVKKYENIVISGINSDKMEIYDKYNNSTILDLGNEVVHQITDSSGKIYEFDDLKEKISLMVAVSFDGLYAEILYCDDYTEGTVSEKDSEDNIVINGVKHKISPELITTGNSIITGKSGVFYLNAYGDVVSYEYASVNDGMLAMLTKFVNGEEDGGESRIRVIPLDDENTLMLMMAEKVRIDGTSYKNANKMENALNPRKKNIIAEVIRYWLNENGEVTAIDTPVLGRNESETDSLIKRWTMDDADLKWKSSGRIGVKFYVDLVGGALYGLSDTLDSTGDISLYSPDVLGDDQTCSCDLYTVGCDSLTVKAVVMKKRDIEGSDGSTSIPIQNYFCVFDKYTEEILDDSDTVVGVVSYYSGMNRETAYIELENAGLIADLKCGDAFLLKKDKKNYIKPGEIEGIRNVVRIYDYENDTFLAPDSNDGRFKLSSGKVYKKTDAYVRIGSPGLNYNEMTTKEKDTELITRFITNSYYGGAVYEVNARGVLIVSTPTYDFIWDYDSVGDNADTILCQTEYLHDRRNCYFRH